MLMLVMLVYQNNAIHNRGYGFLVPIGRSLTRQEEKNDVSATLMISFQPIY